MPDFYVHLRTPAGLEPSDCSLAFESLEDAYLDVCRTIPTLAPTLLKEGHSPLRCTFEITDEHDMPLIEVPFAEVLDPSHFRQRHTSKALAAQSGKAINRTVRLAAEIRATERALKDNLQFLRTLLAQAKGLALHPRADDGPLRSGTAGE